MVMVPARYHDVHVVFSVGAWGNRVHVADAERNAERNAETNAENPHGSAQNKPRSKPRFFPG